MQQCLPMAGSGLHAGYDIALKGWAFFKPFRKLHNENSISYAIREIFAILSKLMVTGSIAYAAANLVVTATPPLGAALITGIFLMCFHKQVANCLPQKIARLVNHLFLRISLVVIPTAILITRNFTPVGCALGAFYGGNFLYACLRKSSNNVIIGTGSEQLDLKTIKQDLQALLTNKRTVDRLEIRHRGDPLELSEEIIDDLKKLRPKHIILSGIQLGEDGLEEINRSLIDQAKESKVLSCDFYHCKKSDLENTTVLELAQTFGDATVVMESKKGEEFTPSCSESYLKQLQLVQSSVPQFKLTVHFKVNRDKDEKNTEKEKITIGHLHRIMEWNPTTITFDTKSLLDDDATVFLNTVQQTSGETFYYKRVSSYEVSRQLLTDTETYTIGYGEKLTEESVKERLIQIRSHKLNTLVLYNAEGSSFESTRDILILFSEMQPRSIHCSLSDEQLQYLNVQLNRDNETNSITFYKRHYSGRLDKTSLVDEYQIDAKDALPGLKECLAISEARGKPPATLKISSCGGYLEQEAVSLLSKIAGEHPMKIEIDTYGLTLPIEFFSALPEGTLIDLNSSKLTIQLNGT